MTRPHVVPLERTRIKDAEAVLARALADDPMMLYGIPDAAERRTKMPALTGSLARYSMTYGTAWTTPEVGGVACWVPPGGSTNSLWRMVRAGMVLMPVRIGPSAFRRVMRVVGHMESVHHREMPEPHWYLALLGTDPDRQGRGIGRALIQHGIDRATADRVPCYLETQNEANLAYYARFGFAVVDASEVDGLRSWSLARPHQG